MSDDDQRAGTDGDDPAERELPLPPGAIPFDTGIFFPNERAAVEYSVQVSRRLIEGIHRRIDAVRYEGARGSLPLLYDTLRDYNKRLERDLIWLANDYKAHPPKK